MNTVGHSHGGRSSRCPKYRGSLQSLFPAARLGSVFSLTALSIEQTFGSPGPGRWTMARRSTNIRLPWSREMDDGSPSYKHAAPLEPDIDDRSEFYKHLVPLG